MSTLAQEHSRSGNLTQDEMTAIHADAVTHHDRARLITKVTSQIEGYPR